MSWRFNPQNAIRARLRACSLLGAALLAIGVNLGANSGGAVFSADGRFVVFVSDADSLVTHCHNGPVTDVFVRDLERGQTALVSARRDGVDGGNRSSHSPAISADGRWIVFESSADDLVDGDTNEVKDIFLYDRSSGGLRRISQRPEGIPGPVPNPGASRNPVITANGQWVFFDSSDDGLVPGDTNGWRDVFRYRMPDGGVELVSQRPAGEMSTVMDSSDPVVDPTGRRVAFRTLRSISLGPIPPGQTDLMIVDLTTGSGGHLTLDSNARAIVGPFQFSPDGRSLAAGIAQSTGDLVVWRNLESGATTLLDVAAVGSLRRSVWTLAFTPDGHHLLTGWRSFARPSVGRVSTNSIWIWTPGQEPTPLTLGADPTTNLLRSSAFDLAADGETLAFRADSIPPGAEGAGLTLGAVHVRKLSGGPISTVALAATAPRFHPSGTRILVETEAPSLTQGKRESSVNLVLRDLATGGDERISEPVIPDVPPGPNSGLAGDPPLLTADGRRVVFVSHSDDLVPGDANRSQDVFLRDLETGEIELISVAADGTSSGSRGSFQPVITPDGRQVAFLSRATNLTVGTPRELAHVFLRDRGSRTTRRISGEPEVPEGAPILNLGLSADGQRVVFEFLDAQGRSQGFVWRNAPGGVPALIPVQGRRQGKSSDQAHRCRLSADGSRVAFLRALTGTPLVLDLDGDFYIAPTFPELLAGSTINGIAINSRGSQFVTAVRYRSTEPFVAVWQSDGGASRELPTYLTSDNGWRLREICDVSFSPDDRFIVLTRYMDSAVPERPGQRCDVLLHDLKTGVTSLVSVNRAGTGPGNGFSRAPSVSAGGRLVAFLSNADDLVLDDHNGRPDVFVRDMDLGVTRRVATTGADTGRPVHGPTLASADRRIAVVEFDAARERGQSPGAGRVAVNLIASQDLDQDGLDDDWERSMFGSALGGPGDDPDGDGMTTLEELLAGTRPDSSVSRLRLNAVMLQNGQVRLSWDSIARKFYSLVRVFPDESRPPEPIHVFDGTDATLQHVEVPAPGATGAYYQLRVD